MEHSFPVHLQRTHTPTPQGVYLNKELAKKLRVTHKQMIELSLGQKAVKTRVLLNPAVKTNTVNITPAVWSGLHIPHQGLIHIKRESNGLRIGPLIGIMTTGIRNDLSAPVGQRSNFFRHLLSAQLKQGVFYFVFSPDSFQIKTMTVKGLFLLPKPFESGYMWTKIDVPLPDVIYDRIPNRMSEKKDYVQSFKRFLNHMKTIRHFNPGFFNKWEIHKRLNKNDRVSQYIPETYHSPDLETVEQMLNKYQMVYLKPTGGSLGLGIIKITKHPKHGYFCRYNRNGRNVLKRFDDLLHLYFHIGGEKRLSRYLVQQGIPLMKYGNRPLDFRVHLHKNRLNEWEVVGSAAKIAGPGSVTTHVRTGGTILSSSEAIHHYFKDRGTEVEERIQRAAVELAEAIEQSLGKPLGEIGLDIGIDRNGHIWMFEANSKPGRHVFRHSSLRYVDKISLRKILDYSKYLANF